MLFKRVGFFIDIDLMFYWLILKFDFELTDIYFNGLFFWHYKTLEILNINIFYCKKQRNYKKLELLLKYPGFIFYNSNKLFFRFNINKEIINLSVMPFFHLKYLRYVAFLCNQKHNRLLLKLKYIEGFLKRYLNYKKTDNKNLNKNLFLNKFLFKNINTFLGLMYYDKLLYNYKKIELFFYTINSIFCVSGFWSFLTSELLYHYILFSNTAGKVNQHKRYKNPRYLYFRYRYILLSSHNSMNVQFFFKRLKQTWVRASFFSIFLLSKYKFKHFILNKFFYKNLKYFNLFNILNKLKYFQKYYLYDHINSIFENFDEIIYFSSKLPIVYPFVFEEPVESIYLNVGSFLGQKKLKNHGDFLVHLLQPIDINIFLDLKMISNIIFTKQIINFMAFFICKKILIIFIMQDLMYYYKDIFLQQSFFKLWHWYCFFDGCDYHTTWGWFGRYAIKKIKNKKIKIKYYYSITLIKSFKIIRWLKLNDLLCENNLNPAFYLFKIIILLF